MSVESQLHRLSLDLRKTTLNTSPSAPRSIPSRPQAATPSDSWEDLASSPSSEEPSTPTLEAPGPTLKSPSSRAADAEKDLQSISADIPSPPPPTPISPSMLSSRPEFPISSNRLTPQQSYNSHLSSGTNSPRDDRERKRPEKTTATANRLIAGALGVKAPPKTKEQREYDRAVKEAEIKRKNREKEERRRVEEEDERVKASVWDS